MTQEKATATHNWKLDPVHGLRCGSRSGTVCNCTEAWSLHEGEDYIVVLGGDYNTTENPIARCHDLEHAERIISAVNEHDALLSEVAELREALVQAASDQDKSLRD